MKIRPLIIVCGLAVIITAILSGPVFATHQAHKTHKTHKAHQVHKAHKVHKTHRIHRPHRTVALAPSSYLLQVNGQTYQEKSPDLRRAPASLTKIMTALIILEHDHLDEVVTVSAAASRETGSRIGLRRGDRLKVRDLLAATLMASANDAARALADHHAGNQAAFVKQMNERARSLHLRNTQFTNACGHDQKGLFTTPNDLVILTERALRIPLFADLVAMRSTSVTTLQGRSYSFHNVNRLIGKYPGARGVKTGTTSAAGKCLVALAERGDTRVLLVLMNSRDRWHTAPAMLDAAFAARSSARGH